MLRLLRVLVLTALALLPALSPGRVLAQPADVRPEVDLRLPELPDGFRSERVGTVQWAYPSAATGVARDLQAAYRSAWTRVASELGEVEGGNLTIRIGRNPEELRALAPAEAPPPAYATGVAYPGIGLVLLSLSVPETWERPDVETVLVHELSHIAFHRATGGQPVPRWLSEGVAVHQAGEQNLERIQTLWSATVAGRLLPLERLDRGFPTRPHEVSLAYAQSADFVRWFRARSDGPGQFRQLLGFLRDGHDLRRSLELATAATQGGLEDEWRQSLSARFQALPLLLGSGGLWVIASPLLVFAYRRRKTEDRDRLEVWAAEEAEEDARLQEAMLADLAEREAARSAPTLEVRRPKLLPDLDEMPSVLFVIPPGPRDSQIPSVEHDGRDHTLH